MSAETKEAGTASIASQVDRILRELRESAAAAGGRNEALMQEVEKVRALVEAREAELRQMQEELGRMGRQAAASSYEAANLRRRVSALESSLSWKITAPLRAVTAPLFRALAKPKAPERAPAPAASRAAPPQTAAPEAVSPVEKILPALRWARSIVVIPCAIPFSATLNQRPISYARYAADHGTTVLYVAWQWKPDEPVPQAGEEVYPGVFCLPLYDFLQNLERIGAASHARSAYIGTLASPELVAAARPLRAAGYHIHYDVMDDWEGFHRGGEAPWFSAPVERELVVLSDTVTAVSTALVHKFEHLRSDIALVRNGYQPSALDCEQFLTARTPPAEPRIVGYFGHFSDAWFDWDTVLYAAGKRPDLVFELIGWGISESTRERLSAFPNIRLPGIVAQKDLHRYVRHWWVAMIPFQPTEVSAAVDPLKIYEYLHFGLHTVVTGISGIAEYPLVRYAAGRESFVTALEGLPDRPDAQSLERAAGFLKACVWEERLGELSRMISRPAGLASLYAPR
jgi:hypothetical protein